MIHAVTSKVKYLPWMPVPPYLLLVPAASPLAFPPGIFLHPILFYTCHQLSRILKCCCFPLSTLPLLSPWFSYGHHGNCLQMVGGSEHCIGGVEGGMEVSGHFGISVEVANCETSASAPSLMNMYRQFMIHTYTANTHALSTTNALMSILSLSLSHTQNTKHSVHLTGTNKLSVQEHYSWEAYQWKQGFTTTCWVKHKENKLMRNLAWMGKEMQHAYNKCFNFNWIKVIWVGSSNFPHLWTDRNAQAIVLFPCLYLVLYHLLCCFFCLYSITVDKSVYSKGGIRNKTKQW